MSEVKDVPGFTKKTKEDQHNYTGAILSKDIKKLLGEPEPKKDTESTKIKAVQPLVKPKTTIKHKSAQTQRVGFSKLMITIPEEIALTILNYAGHSSKKSATLEVWYAKDKQPQIGNPLPTYPLANLYEVAAAETKPKVEALAKSK